MKHLLRGRVLDFHGNPETVPDSHRYIEDGAILIDEGRIVATGPYDVLRVADVPETDHRPHLLMAGFIDPHIHFPQVQVIASWGEQLLDWLNDYVFPEEARFAERRHADRMADFLLDELVRNGTTTALAFASSHPGSVDALLSAAQARDMCVITGKVMMDRNAPASVLDTAQSSYDDSKALIARWHGLGRALYAITPRFAITSTPAQLEAAGVLAREHPGCLIQTHLSENRDEIAYTLSLYPKARDYLDIYEQHGLLSSRLQLGHAIHLEPREIARLAETGARAIHCPTSNLFLGSGLFDARKLHEHGVVTGVATDIGAGTSYSMLQTLNEAYKIRQLRGDRLTALTAFHTATRGNAIALGLEAEIGTLQPGSAADIVVLDPRATPAMTIRAERAERLDDELFILQMLGDDRAVVETYVAGRPQKTRPASASSASKNATRTLSPIAGPVVG
jgi:guanine deaminase